ncbi:tetratricopeptide repeat protein [Proteiniphilum acetatigenes]|uniref:tetratricopeptide repeat protein n=1 Tax=Proteiniphilum acetatigenes TaxID=294710 RepID=UPI000361277D|nr:tetratricopeptide repeat protein [Proteiniphilum acetatigenes]
MLYPITVIKKILFTFFLFVSISAICPVEMVAQQEKQGQQIQLNEETRRKFDYYFYGALNAKALGNYDQAIDLFQHCYALDSTNANVLVELGTFYNVLQEKNKALDFFRRSVTYDPDNYYYNMMLAGLSKELDLKQEVIDIYTHLSQLYPEKLDVRFELANAYAEAGEFQEAVDTLDELEKNTGINEMIALNKFRLYSMMDEKEQAFDEIKQIIEKNPSEPRYLILMGDLYLEDNQNEEALKYYERAKAIDPDYPALILSMVNYYERTNDKQAAQAELQKAVANSSMDVEVKLQLLTRYLGILQQSQQDMKQVNALFETLFEQHPNNSQLNMIYGNVLLLQMDKKGAAKQFEIYTEANPEDPAGYEQLLRIALPDQDLEKIKEVTTEALKHLPQEAQFYFYLGAVHYQQENHREALKVFEDGLANATMRNPIVESDFHGQIGDLNYFLGNKEKAFESYEKALQLNPQNLPVLNNYSYYLSLEKKDLDKAEQMSGITVKAEPTNPTYLDTYGWVLYEQGSYTLAKIYIERAIENSKEDDLSAEVVEHYGDVLFRTGEKEKALEQWKKAKELGGDSPALDKKIKTGKL